MVCFYFYHPGGAPRFSWFSCVFIWWYFWCILMRSCVLFLVRFSRVFCRAFSGVFWWFCWWYFLCFSWCFFHCVLVLFSVLFFVLVPFLFYIRFPLVVVLFFAVLFFVVFGCFFRAFFVLFVVFFVCLLSCFFSCIFSFFFSYFFSSFSFFVPWVAPETNNHNILHFGPCFFRCFFWWSLLVKIGYTQYMSHISSMYGRFCRDLTWSYVIKMCSIHVPYLRGGFNGLGRLKSTTSPSTSTCRGPPGGAGTSKDDVETAPFQCEYRWYLSNGKYMRIFFNKIAEKFPNLGDVLHMFEFMLLFRAMMMVIMFDGSC